LLAAFGSGFTWGSILIKWDLKHWKKVGFSQGKRHKRSVWV
jgi:hypothetical protein